MYVYKNGAIWIDRIRLVGRSMYAIALIMRVLVLIVIFVAALLLAMDAVATESRRMLGNRGGGSAPGSPLPNPNHIHND
jgi:hypothetical protein